MRERQQGLRQIVESCIDLWKLLCRRSTGGSLEQDVVIRSMFAATLIIVIE